MLNRGEKASNQKYYFINTQSIYTRSLFYDVSLGTRYLSPESTQREDFCSFPWSSEVVMNFTWENQIFLLV